VPKIDLTTFIEGIHNQAALEQARDLPDGELLERFVTRRDSAAFTALVGRHGPMVMGVCRRLLRRREDAEDASQATFLVLAHKAAAVRKRESLPSWLHGVALRIARKARTEDLRQRGREVPAVDVPDADPSSDISLREALAVLDEELNRLPVSYRSPLILCYLEGKTQDEAARELALSVGAFRGRLERARERLRGRVTRRGVTLPALLLGTGLSIPAAQAAVCPAFLTATVGVALRFAADQAASPAVTARVVALAKGVTTMRITKLCILGLTAAACLGLAVGVVAVHRVLNAGTQAVAEDRPPAPAPGKPVWHPRVTIGGHFGWACYVELSSDGKILATYDPSHSELRFWDTATWKERAVHPLKRVFSHGGTYRMPLFSRDSKSAVAEGQHAWNNGRPAPAVALFDVPTGKVRAILPGALSTFSADGKLLAAGVNGAVKVYDAVTAKERLTLPVKGDWSKGQASCYHLWFSPDGKTLATSRDGVVKLWDMAAGKERASMSGYFPLWNYEMPPFSPDSKTFVTAAKEDCTLKLWETVTGKERAPLRGHALPYVGAIFSPDGKTLATMGTPDGIAAGVKFKPEDFDKYGTRRPVEVKLWDVATGKELRTLPGNTFLGNRAHFSPDGKTLAYLRGVPAEEARCVSLWDLETNKERTVIPGDHVGVFSPDSKLLMVQSGRGVQRGVDITFYDTATGKLVASIKGDPNRQVGFLSFSRDWRTLVTSAFYTGHNEQRKPRPNPDKVETQITVWQFSDRPVKKETRGGSRPAAAEASKKDAWETKAEKGAKVGSTWEALKKEIEVAEQELFAKRRSAKTDEESRVLGEAILNGRERYVPRLLDLARAHLRKPAAVEALELTLRFTAAAPTQRLAQLSGEIMALVRRDFLKSPALDRLLPGLEMQESDASEALLAAALKENPHRAVRGRAAEWLARRLVRNIETAQLARVSPEATKRALKDQPDLLKRLMAINPEKASRRAEELFELMRKEYSDVKQVELLPTTLGEVAERGLYALRNLSLGKKAPEIEGTDLDGKPLKLSDARGKVVVLVFCGYWCGPCRAMIPHERALVKRLEGKPFALFWINSDKDRVLTREKMTKDGANWRSWWDGGRRDGPIGTRWNIESWPTVYVLDSEGTIRMKATGDPWEALDRMVETLLKERASRS
jgi:RNA polymerase sigma factor (sigma-70 family)